MALALFRELDDRIGEADALTRGTLPGEYLVPERLADDVEALERCQKGFRAHSAAPWNDLSRGMNGHVDNSEGQMRVFWRQWNRLVNGVDLRPEEIYAFDPAEHGRPVAGLAAD